MNNTAIKLTKISKKYILQSGKTTLLNSIKGGKKEEFWVLKNINLTIKKGESIGIIGPNGAGKSTLLKIIAGITKPSSGKLEVDGKVIALMNLDAGFHPDLSGKENIFLNGMLGGMNKKTIEKKYTKIIKYAGIGDFIELPFYTYSDGMKFRLAFSIAIESSCDILIMDEVFISGDIDFQHKIIDTIHRFQKKGVTTIVCSHVPLYVWGFSDTFFEIKAGILKPLPKKKISKTIRDEDERWSKLIRYPFS